MEEMSVKEAIITVAVAMVILSFIGGWQVVKYILIYLLVQLLIVIGVTPVVKKIPLFWLKLRRKISKDTL